MTFVCKKSIVNNIIRTNINLVNDKLGDNNTTLWAKVKIKKNLESGKSKRQKTLK